MRSPGGFDTVYWKAGGLLSCNPLSSAVARVAGGSPREVSFGRVIAQKG